MKTNKEFLTPSQAAKEFRINVNSIYNAIRVGCVQRHYMDDSKVKDKTHYLVSREEVYEWRKQANDTKKTPPKSAQDTGVWRHDRRRADEIRSEIAEVDDKMIAEKDVREFTRLASLRASLHVELRAALEGWNIKAENGMQIITPIDKAKNYMKG